MPVTLGNTIPAELASGPPSQLADPSAALGESLEHNSTQDSKIVSYVVDWRNKLRNNRKDKMDIWNECWQLYRGLEDFSDKEEWQSRMVLPKAWASVKQATSTIKRLLSTAKSPWTVEAVNPDDLVTALRAGQMTDLAKVFLEDASYMEEFATGLECSFIIGVGVWKLWWGLTPRQRTQVQQVMDEATGQPMRRLVQEEILEGHLQIRAVDPYNFYWLPGSKMNRWVGTLEEIEVPKWELVQLAEQGLFDYDKVKDLPPSKLSQDQKQEFLRFSERTERTPSQDTDNLRLLEFYGPCVIDGKVLEKDCHILIANDTTLLKYQRNAMWNRKPPYVGVSPLSLPFRTEGVGLVEMVRQIDKNLSKLANMSVDTLLFRLMPLFEVWLDAYENPEDFETGLNPGKILRRNSTFVGQPGISAVKFEDISQGAVQVSAQLDRSHQEGALVSEIQQALPRFRGLQSATEISEKADNQDSFFGAMAADIEQQALEPMIEMAVDLIFQFIDTANDPRIASILGVGADAIRGMSREELLEMIQGDYKVKVTGITGQLQKAEMLNNLVQFMNILGQNPEAWMPYLNQDALLRRILEAFRPAIHDLEDIIADPATVEARKAAASAEQLTPEAVAMIPTLVQQAREAQQAQQAQLQQAQEVDRQQQEMQLRREEMDHEMAMEAAKEASKSESTNNNNA
jgi:hypothetical protein